MVSVDFDSHLVQKAPQDLVKEARKMKIAVVYVTLVSLAITTDGKKFNRVFWPSIFLSKDFSDDCTNNNCERFLPKKRGDADDFEGKQTMNIRRLFDGSLPWSCACESQYNIEDLGPGNYPRYIASAQCVIKPCHNKFNQCKLVHYKVHILKQREINDGSDTSEDQYIEQSILPESLRVKWQLKPVKTAVACVAASDGWKN